jgi:hypothetical protein
MKKMLCPLAFSMAVLALLVFSPIAESSNRPTVGIGEYFEMLSSLREDLEQGEPRQLNASEWQEFDRIEGRFQRLLGDVEAIDDLRDRDRLRIFNLQEELDTLLVGREEEQVICERRRSTGSRIPRQNCRTLSQIRQEQARAQQFVHGLPLIQNQPGGN